MKTPAQRWNELSESVETFEGPSEKIAEHGGIPTDTCYGYVSSSFLDGLVNYFSDRRVFLINRYGIKDQEDKPVTIPHKTPREQYDELTRLPICHFNPLAHDDCLIFAQTEKDYWIFWYDRDCSDCFLWRISKETAAMSFEELVSAFNDDMRERHRDWGHYTDHDEAIIVEYPKATRFGWISTH